MKNIPLYIIGTLIILCFGVSFVEISLNLRQEELSKRADYAWSFFFIVLVSFWVQKDSKSADFDKPFDFGFFLYLFLPILLPYYLLRTRGIEGIVTFLGFVAIHYIPFISGLLAYVYFT